MKTQPSKAWLKVQEKRNTSNSGHLCWIANDLSSVVYLFDNDAGKPCARGYTGRKLKPTFSIYFKNKLRRTEYIKCFQQENSAKKARKIERKTVTRKLKVGDVLYSTWGYEQTNVDFFKVLSLVGKTMVEVIKIAADKDHKDIDHGSALPLPNDEIGKPFKRKVYGKGLSITINQVSCASLLDFKTNPLDGSREYKPVAYSSWY